VWEGGKKKGSVGSLRERKYTGKAADNGGLRERGNIQGRLQIMGV